MAIDQIAPMLSAIPSLPRPVLARLTLRLIERLDELDGDTDLEEGDPDYCLASDDGCGPVRHMQDGGLAWGSDHDAEGCVVPAYGIDQTRGPIDVSVNVREYLDMHGV